MGASIVSVVKTSEIPEGTMKMVQLGVEEVLVANVGGKYYAIGNSCTHVGGALHEGTLDGHIVECPLHGSRFDVRNGQVVGPPAQRPEPTYEVKVEGPDLIIKSK